MWKGFERVLIRKSKRSLWCRRCGESLRNGLSPYCLDCRYELDRLRRKQKGTDA